MGEEPNSIEVWEDKFGRPPSELDIHHAKSLPPAFSLGDEVFYRLDPTAPPVWKVKAIMWAVPFSNWVYESPTGVWISERDLIPSK